MTTRNIADMFMQLYGAEVSDSLISKVTEAVLDEVNIWRNHLLDAVYPIVYLDCIHAKVSARQMRCQQSRLRRSWGQHGWQERTSWSLDV